MSEAAREWKVGDLVRLASGGPVMTVYDVHEVVCCAWFDRERFTHREGFHAAVLVPHQSAGFSEHVLTDAVMAELQELRLRYLELGWETAIGSSGTILAVSEICQMSGLGETEIRKASLHKIRDQLLEFKKTADVQFPGLSDQRQPVLTGGLVMLAACFETFGLESIRTSPYALREGLLYEFEARLQHHHIRERTAQALGTH